MAAVVPLAIEGSVALALVIAGLEDMLVVALAETLGMNCDTVSVAV